MTSSGEIVCYDNNRGLTVLPTRAGAHKREFSLGSEGAGPFQVWKYSNLVNMYSAAFDLQSGRRFPIPSRCMLWGGWSVLWDGKTATVADVRTGKPVGTATG